MLDLKDLDCLIALARHRHFAKAAEACGLSQPAFSMRIRHLEERLGTRIVKRGNRFQGLTPEGEAVVAHARGILDGVRALEEDVRAARGEVLGVLSLAAIPTAAVYAGALAHKLRQAHPGIRTRIETTTSLGVQQGIDDGRYDAGLTYTEGASEDLMRVEPLYEERYVLMVPDALLRGTDGEIGWAEAAELPLILLEPGMQNRRILDRVFESVGAHPSVVAETSGFTAAVVMARGGMGAVVLPVGMAEMLGDFPGVTLLPLVAPEVQKSVALVSPRRGRRLPAVEALRRVALVET